MTERAPGRLASLDTVRGVAVMGILLMNIVAFAMPEAAYFNPRAYGGSQGADLAVWLVNFVLFDGKMRGLFSFLFGASMLLVIERAEAGGEDPARVHYARMGWLLVFGLAHLWLVWWGDILNHYALVGMVAFAFRGKDVRSLVVAAGALLVIDCLVMGTLAGLVGLLVSLAASGDPAQAAAAAKGLAGFNETFGIPPADALAADLALHRGGYAAILADRFAAQAMGPVSGLMVYGWETLAYMLLGMAALKSGLLAGGWPRARYLKWMAIGFGIGIPAYLGIAAWLVASDFSLMAVVGGAMGLATPARPLMILGWACLILLLMRPGGAITARVAAAGRMAFTQLSGDQPGLHRALLRLWARLVRLSDARRAILCRNARVAGDSGMVQALARTLPLRPPRMALAQPGALAAPADARRRAQRMTLR